MDLSKIPTLELEKELKRRIENEIWKPVVGWEKYYEVSNEGKVKSKERYRKMGLMGNVKMPPKLLNLNTKHPYIRVSLTGEGSKIVSVHRLVAEAFLPNPENKLYVNHKDCNTHNNTVDNLEWCTQSENTIHAIKMGRFVPRVGEDASSAKLTEKDVMEIRNKYKEGQPVTSLSVEYGIGKNGVYRILRKEVWKHI